MEIASGAIFYSPKQKDKPKTEETLQKTAENSSVRNCREKEKIRTAFAAVRICITGDQPTTGRTLSSLQTQLLPKAVRL